METSMRERRREVPASVAVDAAAAGWPLMGRRRGEQEGCLRTSKDEDEGLMQQFTFLKPCRQLEKQYVGRRNAGHEQGGGSFRHVGDGARRKVEENSQCRLRESDARPATVCGRGGVRATSTRAVEEADLCGVGEAEKEVDSISVAARRALARKLSRDGIELNSFVAEAERVASPRRSVSERFATTRGHEFHRDVWRISSTRCSIHEKEAHIDLVAPAAAKFLVETTPRQRQHYYYCDASASPPAVAVPFQWEDAPGRAKPATAARTSPDALQLPPRLAIPSRAAAAQSSLSRVSTAVVSHPLAGLFPCMTAASPSSCHHRARDPPAPTKAPRKLNKSFSQPLASTDASPTPKPRRLFSSELKPHDPTSILHHSGRHSSTSTSSRTYLSCELDSSTPRSKSSSSVSYESIGEDFVDSPRSSVARPGLLKLSCLRKSKSRGQRLCSPEVWTYLQHLDGTHEDVSTLLPVGGAPTSSGYLNSRGEPVAVSADSSTEKATRLPYKMPSVEEQERAARREEVCAAASALEMLSPAVSIMASRRQHRGGPRQPPGWAVGPPKPHRRVQFILSVCKTLKRVLFRQQPRRSVIGTRLMYHDERAPTTFQFSKPN